LTFKNYNLVFPIFTPFPSFFLLLMIFYVKHYGELVDLAPCMDNLVFLKANDAMDQQKSGKLTWLNTVVIKASFKRTVSRLS